MLRHLFLFFASIPFLASAQYAGFTTVTDLGKFRQQYAEHSARINTITSSFVQEKNLVALTEKITSMGTFQFKRNNKVRLEYVTPFQYLMVMNGDKMTIKDDSRSSSVNLKSSKLFQQINNIIVDCIQGTILESKDFSTRVFENKEYYLLEMTPTGKNLKTFFQAILLYIDKKDYSAHSIHLNEPSGDDTIITFTEKKVNGPVKDEAFSL